MYTVHNNFRKALYAEEFNIAYFLNPKLQKLHEKNHSHILKLQ